MRFPIAPFGAFSLARIQRPPLPIRIRAHAQLRGPAFFHAFSLARSIEPHGIAD